MLRESAGDERRADRAERTRYLFEVTLKYAACIAISSYLRDPRRDAQTDAALSCLTRPSLGHWLNLFRRCTRHQQSLGLGLFPAELFERTSTRPAMVRCMNALKEALEPGSSSAVQGVSLLHLLEAMIAYRNRTTGHGAPSREQIEKMSGFLEEGVVDLILHAEVLQKTPLVFVSEIRAERRSFVHSLTRLVGTSPMTIPDFVTDRDGALLGADKQLFLCDPESMQPQIPLHPLVIYAQQDVFLLHQSDLNRNVQYLCHHSGAFYTADRLFEDFKEQFGSMLGAELKPAEFNPEDVYLSTVRISLVDGVLADEERRYLDELRVRLNLIDGRADELEAMAWAEMNAQVPAPPSPSPARSASPDAKPPAPEKRRPTRTADQPVRLLFLSYASIRLGFWADLVSRMAALAHRRGMVFSMVAVDPSEDHDATAMMGLVSEMDRILGMHQPDVVAVAPSPSRAFTELFDRHFERFKIPLVALDSPFVPTDAAAPSATARAPLVQIDNYEAGRLAAQMLLEHASKRGTPHQFLVLPGLENARHSGERVRGFREAMAASGGVRVKALQAGGFDRQRAKHIFEEFAADADLSRFSGIFCCSDEMALGVYVGLRNLAAESATEPAFGIVGFNNTDEMQSAMLMDRSGSLVGTIDQNLPSYAYDYLRSSMRWSRVARRRTCI